MKATVHVRLVLSLVLVASLGCGGKEAVLFDLTIENVGPRDGVTSADGTYRPTFSPGWVSVDGAMFEVGRPATPALELLAESGDPVLFVAEGGGSAFPEEFELDYLSDPLNPGDTFQVRFAAQPGDSLSLGMMLIQSNDTFAGVRAPLFTDGTPIEGDISSAVRFYDAGTEINDPEHQPSNGLGGDDEMGVVQVVDGAPPASDVLRLRLRVSRPD